MKKEILVRVWQHVEKYQHLPFSQLKDIEEDLSFLPKVLLTLFEKGLLKFNHTDEERFNLLNNWLSVYLQEKDEVELRDLMNINLISEDFALFCEKSKKESASIAEFLTFSNEEKEGKEVLLAGELFGEIVVALPKQITAEDYSRAILLGINPLLIERSISIENNNREEADKSLLNGSFLKKEKEHKRKVIEKKQATKLHQLKKANWLFVGDVINKLINRLQNNKQYNLDDKEEILKILERIKVIFKKHFEDILLENLQKSKTK